MLTIVKKNKINKNTSKAHTVKNAYKKCRCFKKDFFKKNQKKILIDDIVSDTENPAHMHIMYIDIYTHRSKSNMFVMQICIQSAPVVGVERLLTLAGGQ